MHLCDTFQTAEYGLRSAALVLAGRNGKVCTSSPLQHVMNKKTVVNSACMTAVILENPNDKNFAPCAVSPCRQGQSEQS